MVGTGCLGAEEGDDSCPWLKAKARLHTLDGRTSLCNVQLKSVVSTRGAHGKKQDLRSLSITLDKPLLSLCLTWKTEITETPTASGGKD